MPTPKPKTNGFPSRGTVQQHSYMSGWWPWLSTWGSVLGYCVLIFVLSAQPDLQVPKPFEDSDKLAHLCLYAGLGGVWARAVRAQWPGWTALQVLLVTLLFTAGYGASDEWHQAYVPGRFADLRDIWADGVGGVLGGQCYLFVWRRSLQGERRQQSGNQDPTYRKASSQP